MDFYEISETRKSNGVTEIYPEFFVGKHDDLMIKGGDFYAVWIEDKKLWSTKEDDLIKIIDRDIRQYVKDNKARLEHGYSAKYMKTASSGSIDRWHKYCQKQMRDNFVPLDEKLIFQDQETTRESYATKKLPYALKEGSIENYDKLMSVLYSPEERLKLEWSVGAIVSGDSVNIQKFIVLYGAQGTGKGTFISIIQKLFDGYWERFQASALGSSTNVFSLEAFKSNPLVAIDTDGNLSKIEDNSTLNALTAHEVMSVNAKYEKLYSQRFNSFLYMGSNKPVKITDAKSGLLRRMIDVNPTGNTVPKKEYNQLMKNINFELGAIAKHCLDIYLEEPDRYDGYVPLNMMDATNDFYNFMVENYHIFKRDDGVSLRTAWEMYKAYIDDARVQYPFSYRVFKEELKNYFDEYLDRFSDDDGSRVRSYYKGFKTSKFEKSPGKKKAKTYQIELKAQHSIIDDILADCPAQEAVGDPPRPKVKWANCKTKLSELDTSKLHYILPNGHETLIRMDFDFKNEKGEKDLEINLREASKWPKTYAEVSKSGGGIHLYYYYTGDVGKLSNVYDDNIEIKVPKGNSAIRRKLTLCNDIPIATISSGLPLKGDDNVAVSKNAILSEKQLRTFIKRCLNKEHHGATKPEVDFIFKVLEDKYKTGELYDVTDMRNAVLAFAASSTHQSDICIKLVGKMHFKSEDEDPGEVVEFKPGYNDSDIVIFDLEVYPNFSCICWKIAGSVDEKVHDIINPTPDTIETFLQIGRLVGFNCRRYDNHIVHGMRIGYSNKELFELSQNIILNNQGFFRDAYDYSYTDIYDYSSKKQSLKKWEIELGIHHQEMGIPWDQDVPKELIPKVLEYCHNDVYATEAVWNATQSDFVARQILADLTGLSVNDTTNTLTARLIFGKEKKPQSQFNYRNLAEPVVPDDIPYEDLPFVAWNGQRSLVPFFPGYEFKNGKSYYRGEEIGEGGKVYAEPGIYYDVPVLDVTSMHPSSIIAENLFGPYTQIFAELVKARVIIKHAVKCKEKGDDAGYLYQLAQIRSLTMIGDKLSKYLGDFEKLKNLPQALKIAINSVYGLTAAAFENPFRDPRNVDNIVAKRGALFMTDLKFAVQERGYTVAHIKTDSIKIPQATLTIREFVENFGKMYGYSFEVEDEYEKMGLVNDAVYIAKEKGGKWTATGTQFQVPYVFKMLFSGEEIGFDDLCETKAVTGSSNLYLDFNESLPEGEHNYSFVGRIGRFCPIRPGFGGGGLFREKDGKYYAAAGTKGWRWKEAEVVKTLGQQNEIDVSYYDRLCDEAVKAINEAGKKFDIDYNTFVSDDIPVDLPF